MPNTCLNVTSCNKLLSFQSGSFFYYYYDDDDDDDGEHIQVEAKSWFKASKKDLEILELKVVEE